MYAASPSPFVATARAASALYTKVGVETAVDGAEPHRLIALLFDGLVESIAQARGAMRERNAALKGRAIGRAVRIVDEGLKAALDLRGGGELARDLDALYAYLLRRLTHAHLRDDEAALGECQRLIEPLRSAWRDIAPAAGSAVAA
jgi:flagellar protein FliS